MAEETNIEFKSANEIQQNKLREFGTLIDQVLRTISPYTTLRQGQECFKKAEECVMWYNALIMSLPLENQHTPSTESQIITKTPSIKSSVDGKISKKRSK